MSQPGHQFGQTGAGSSCHSRAGMPQIVPPKVRPTGRFPRRIEMSVKRRRCKMTTMRSGKQQPISAELGKSNIEVVPDRGHQVRRNSHIPNTCIALWPTYDRGRCAGHSYHSAANMNHPGLEINVATAQLDQLTEPQTTPG